MTDDCLLHAFVIRPGRGLEATSSLGWRPETAAIMLPCWSPQLWRPPDGRVGCWHRKSIAHSPCTNNGLLLHVKFVVVWLGGALQGAPSVFSTSTISTDFDCGKPEVLAWTGQPMSCGVTPTPPPPPPKCPHPPTPMPTVAWLCSEKNCVCVCVCVALVISSWRLLPARCHT